jgi:hypothetical protein
MARATQARTRHRHMTRMLFHMSGTTGYVKCGPVVFHFRQRECGRPTDCGRGPTRRAYLLRIYQFLAVARPTGAAWNTVPAVAFRNQGLAGSLLLRLADPPGPRHLSHHPRGPGLPPISLGFSATSPPKRSANACATSGLISQVTTPFLPAPPEGRLLYPAPSPSGRPEHRRPACRRRA